MTNPTLPAYSDFATQEVMTILHQDLCPTEIEVSPTLQQLFNEGCTVLTEGGAPEIRQFIVHNTQRQDLMVCSLYTTELPQYSLKVLGIFNQFYLLS